MGTARVSSTCRADAIQLRSPILHHQGLLPFMVTAVGSLAEGNVADMMEKQQLRKAKRKDY